MNCPCFYYDTDLNANQDDLCTCGHNMDEHDEDLECHGEYVESDETPVAIHYCENCSRPSEEHSQYCHEMYCDAKVHYPPLCCPECPCGSYAEAHSPEKENMIEWKRATTHPNEELPCIEVKIKEHQVRVRSSEFYQAELGFSRLQWEEFVKAIKTGAFDI